MLDASCSLCFFIQYIVFFHFFVTFLQLWVSHFLIHYWTPCWKKKNFPQKFLVTPKTPFLVAVIEFS